MSHPVDKNAPKAPKRGQEIEVAVPLVYGTVSSWLGKKSSETHSHRWTVYVRSPHNNDLSAIIARVVFTLHTSFNDPVQEVTTPPFEVSESGWGEFEIRISIFLHPDSGVESPIELLHGLKLYADNEGVVQSLKRPVVVETYDELLLMDPPDEFLNSIRLNPAVIVFNAPPPQPGTVVRENGGAQESGSTKIHALVQWFKTYSEEEELKYIASMRKKVAVQMREMQRRLALADAEVQSLRASAAS